MELKRAVFPGSFDPFTKGHESVVLKASVLFDEVIIAIGINTNKNYAFDLEKRIDQIKSIYADNAKVRVESFSGLTVDFCEQVQAAYLVRGLRDTKDFEYEKAIAQMNLTIKGIETVFFMTDSNYAAVSSSIVRELFKNQYDVSPFVSHFSKLT